MLQATRLCKDVFTEHLHEGVKGLTATGKTVVVGLQLYVPAAMAHGGGQRHYTTVCVLFLSLFLYFYYYHFISLHGKKLVCKLEKSSIRVHAGIMS